MPSQMFDNICRYLNVIFDVELGIVIFFFLLWLSLQYIFNWLTKMSLNTVILIVFLNTKIKYYIFCNDESCHPVQQFVSLMCF